MPIQGVDLFQMPTENAIQLIAKLFNVPLPLARQILAAELGQSFDDVIKKGDLPPIVIDNSGRPIAQ
jgi:hypothetical protein